MSSKMQVWLVTAVGKRLSIEVSPDMNVAELFVIASERLGQPPEQFHLVHQGKSLHHIESASVQLSSINVQAGASIHAIVRIVGGTHAETIATQSPSAQEHDETSPLRIVLIAPDERRVPLNLPHHATFRDLVASVEAATGVDRAACFLGINTLRLAMDSPDQDASLKDGLRLRDNDTVCVLRRVVGGGELDPDTLWELIAYDLESQIDNLPFQATDDDCEICCETARPLVAVCHLKYCRECLLTQLKTSNFNVRCKCGVESGVEQLLHSLKSILTSFRETQDLLRNVDVQVCRCGTMLFNDTLNPWSICVKCNFQMCFFCKRPWDRATMSHKTPYRCGDACPFMDKFKYSSKPFVMGPAGSTIPDHRMCPSCSVVGAYDEKCKYHKCSCGHRFCFFCLEPENVCNKTSSYGTVCKLVEQGPHQLKHLIAQPKVL